MDYDPAMPPTKSARRTVSPADIERIYRVFDDRRRLIEDLQHTCTIQFERIAQMQAQLDLLERKVNQLLATPPADRRRH